MNPMLVVALEIASPLVAGVVGFWLRRALAKQDEARDTQTRLIREIKDQLTGMRETLATLKTRSEYHHDEITRFRNLVDRWNQGPPA